uniref:Uncharacterized protein n=1 Tax=Anguilla anguilla TaxID=7936 RepID=A0A0E9PTY3_ANGAN
MAVHQILGSFDRLPKAFLCVRQCAHCTARDFQSDRNTVWDSVRAALCSRRVKI